MMIYSRDWSMYAIERASRLKQYRYSHYQLMSNVYKEDIPNCEHPIFIRKQMRYVPCGHCPICAQRAKKEWELRCNLQLQHYKKGEYITLTFDDDHVCDTSYRQIQLFLKRLRKIYKDISYFCAFEKGDTTGRPHYHILIFNFSRPYPIDPKRWNEILAYRFWQNGNVVAYPMTTGNIPYVIGYVSKKLTEQQDMPVGMKRRDYTRANVWSANDVDFASNIKAPLRREAFYKMSKGIGFCFLKNLKRLKAVLKKGFFQFGKRRFRFPRCLDNKLQELGLDWRCPEYFDMQDKINQYSQKQPRFSDVMSFCDIMSLEINQAKQLLFEYIQNKQATLYQRSLNLTKMRV